MSLTKEQLLEEFPHGEYTLMGTVDSDLLLELEERLQRAVKWGINPERVSIFDFHSEAVSLERTHAGSPLPRMVLFVFRHKRTEKQQAYWFRYIGSLATTVGLIQLARE